MRSFCRFCCIVPEEKAHPRVSPVDGLLSLEWASESRRRQAPVVVLRLTDSLNTCLRFLEVQKVHLLTSRTFHFHMPRAGHPPLQKQPPTSDAPHLFERETSVERTSLSARLAWNVIAHDPRQPSDARMDVCRFAGPHPELNSDTDCR